MSRIIAAAAIALLAGLAIGGASGWSWRASRCDAAAEATKLAGRTKDTQAARELGASAIRQADTIAAADAANQERIRELEAKVAAGCVAGPAGLERLRRIK